MKFTKSTIALLIASTISILATDAYAASRSSSSSSRSMSSSSSISRPSSNSHSYTSSSSSSTKSQTTYHPVAPSQSTSGKNTVYKPVSKTVAPTPTNSQPQVTRPKQQSTTAKQSTPSRQSYSTLKRQKYSKGKSSNFMTWVLLAWILSDSNKSNASSSTPEKEIIVDCKQWLKENGHKSNDIEKLSDKDFLKIKNYCESVAK